jgi:hypothetical protein
MLLGTKDLLNPEWEPQDAAKNIRDVKVVPIRAGSVKGHALAGGAFPADVDWLNREDGAFLDLVTDGGKKLDTADRPANAGQCPTTRVLHSVRPCGRSRWRLLTRLRRGLSAGRECHVE